MGVQAIQTNDTFEQEVPRQDTNRAKELTTIKVSQELADLIKLYCVFNNTTMTDFVTEILENELDDFKKKILLMKNNWVKEKD